MDTQISLPFIYDFDRALDRLSGDPLNSVDVTNRILRIPMDEGNVITVKATGTKDEPSFILSGALNKNQIQKINEILHFNDSLDEISAHFANTDLATIFQEHEGTPLIRSFSLYGTLMRSIIHQQLNMSFANTLSLRFVEAFGSETDGVLRYPSPEIVANLEVETLREMQFSSRKAEYMIGLSQAIAEGSLELESLRQMDDDEVTAKLTAYRGVGPWTAQGFLMFGLGRPNLFPIADIGLQNALKILWKLEKKPTKEEIIARFPHWTPYLSYAALYLWRSIE
ncbi:DNA-3-methyladenine glycosylase 2 family protein [Sporosarcina sp. Marseille-Q4063]|uniref:DNA-3-methyladenine glycosylase family protein n=1 Tax=Sporosarcina sp. Marseille-Q4063 TaxID=2810514 RepID=UPI001BAF2DF8|nr:DNA-3-methyladenine glycosylase [Sporosarcina sp. Marseille-Q4063]QUW24076.1 DNA-3-methyladenine glycosylase 2 family protein [Sporosarcina sp. Marseille-Q4063]